MNVYTLNFIREENKSSAKKKAELKKISKTQKKKLRLIKRIKLKESKINDKADKALEVKNK